MAVVVQQTLPFDAKALDLASSSRWNALFPLIRPSVQPFRTAKGQTMLVDTARANSPFVHVATIGTLGKFSSATLDHGTVTAIVTEQVGAGVLSVDDIVHTIHAAGGARKQGIVVVKIDRARDVRVHGADMVEVDVEDELVADHLLCLLGHATDSCRASMHQVVDLVRKFVDGARVARSRFHREKAEGNPAVLHVDGARGFARAKQAVEKDLKGILQAGAASEDDVFSIHYSDVNGLSRLENYILAKEIAEHFKSQKLAYRISHSTILDHGEQGWGFGISIVPLPSPYLATQALPKRHEPAPAQDNAPVQRVNSLSSKSVMTFTDAEVRRRIEAGCAALIAEEPTITEYDTIVGDGDCGYTLRDGAKQVLSFISGKDLGRLPEMVGELVADLEINMGGTSGALYCIFLTALSQSLATEASIPAALQRALEQLLKYTRARLGDRTMMDALIPFVDCLASTRDVGQAVSKAQQGVEGTRQMEAKLGRSTYLDASSTEGVPDPGAYGLWVLLKGMAA